jgi:hypothetical protein
VELPALKVAHFAQRRVADGVRDAAAQVSACHRRSVEGAGYWATEVGAERRGSSSRRVPLEVWRRPAGPRASRVTGLMQTRSAMGTYAVLTLRELSSLHRRPPPVLAGLSSHPNGLAHLAWLQLAKQRPAAILPEYNCSDGRGSPAAQRWIRREDGMNRGLPAQRETLARSNKYRSFRGGPNGDRSRV